MAKSDSFFIRAKATTNGATFVQTEIDLGSFVNLGVSKSTILRIHNISVEWADSSGPEYPIYCLTASPAQAAWQLTTQTKGAMVTSDDKSLVSSGGYLSFGDPNSTAHALSASQDHNMNPQDWRNGYLIGVDSCFLGVDTVGTFASGELDCCIVIECTLETATQASSTALALSQQ